MKHLKNDCKGMDHELAEMLLDSRPASAKVQSHVAGCGRCQAELDQLQATMRMMDAWQAPEPDPYFMTRLNARLREARASEPAGWLGRTVARLRASLVYGSGLHVRPLAAMALTVTLLVGGGAYLGVTDWMHPAQSASQAAVVSDLQTLDNNAQVLDEMEALSTSDDGNTSN
jgi:hypothetical protein